MTKREVGVRLLNIVSVVIFMALYLKGNVFVLPGFYISAVYILYLILKPFMLRQPLSQPSNVMFELFDELFVIGIAIFVSPAAMIPLSMFVLLRCALLFKIFSVLLIYVMIIVYYVFTYSTTDMSEIYDLVISALILVIPPCMVCFIKKDVILIDEKNRDLNEKIRIKTAVIDELQKYSDMLFVGDHRKEDDMLRTDYVTQIPNRYHFEEMLRQGIKSTAEPSFNMGIVMVYVENLYQYRIKYSYSTEHLLIKRLHDLIAEHVRSNDFIARYEDDCIAVLLFNKDIQTAEDLAKIIYSDFESIKFNEPELSELSLRIMINDIENSMTSDNASVDVMKFLNRGKSVEFFTTNSINEHN